MKLVELLSDISIETLLDKDASNISLDELEITDICSDSRRVKPGSLFVCLNGKKEDGHNYIANAICRGAICILAESGAVFDRSPFKSKNAPLLLFSKDTRMALSQLYDTWFAHPAKGMKLVAVTGTNGKTSVTHMLRAIFSAALYKTGIIGTVACYSGERLVSLVPENKNSNMTTPDPKELFEMLSIMRDDGVDIVFIEASSHALALQKLCPLHFDLAVFTNLTPDHLDFHGTMENYLHAKEKLFSMTEIAVINGDDEYGEKIVKAAEQGGCRDIRVCSIDEAYRGDYSALSVRYLGTEGVEYVLSSVCSVFKIRSPIPGKFTVMNTLQAAAAALLLGVDCRIIRDALMNMKGIEGRFQRIKLCAEANFSVFVDYAHTPDALENLLMTARSFRKAGQRIVLLFGCGGDRDKSKRSVMGRIASRLADFVIVTSDNSRSEEPAEIISDIIAGFDFSARASVITIINREEAIEYAVENAFEGDIILLAGKGHEEYELDKNGKRPFSEKRIAVAAAEKFYGKHGKKEGNL